MAGDTLALPSPPAGVVSAFDATTGVLTLSGTASDAAYAQALETVSFQHDGAVAAGSRTVTFSVTDDAGATSSTTETVNVPSFAPASAPVSAPTAIDQPAAATVSVATAADQLGLATEATNLLRASTSELAANGASSSLQALGQSADAIAAQLNAGTMTSAAAQSALLHLADGSTSVAELTYNFFTGSTPTSAGLDYLVNSAANATDLNDSYYTSFSMQNRYINFSVSLAKGGVGTSAYHAAYDGLSLADATSKAYATIFGTTASPDKIAAILDAQVSDGMGGTETRAQYFASYGGDGVSGAGTKAAAIGWLLADSVTEGVGVYQTAETHFLQALAHGTAEFGVDLLASYGAAPTLVGQPVASPTAGS